MWKGDTDTRSVIDLSVTCPFLGRWVGWENYIALSSEAEVFWRMLDAEFSTGFIRLKLCCSVLLELKVAMP